MSQAGPTYESSLLLTLEEISRLVSHSHDPAETLTNIVELIQRLFRTDVCSVYLLEPERGELLLVATIGLESTFQVLPIYLRLSNNVPAAQAFGGPVILLIWLYVMAVIIVFGAEVNWTFARRAVRESAVVGLA